MSDNRESSEIPLQRLRASSEPPALPSSGRGRYALDPEVAEYLVAPLDDSRIPMFPPYWDDDEDDARRRGRRFCKHDVVAREYALDENETCESCGRVPALGWFYRCNVDTSGFSHQMDPNQALALSPSIVNAIKAGHYNAVQKNIVEWQKQRVLQMCAADNDLPVPRFETTQVIDGIEDDDDENPHVEIVEDVAQESRTLSPPPARPRGLRPICSYRACHHCAPRYQDKSWMSINEVCNDDTISAPTAWDLREQPVTDAKVVCQLGLRPSPAYPPEVTRPLPPQPPSLTRPSPGDWKTYHPYDPSEFASAGPSTIPHYEPTNVSDSQGPGPSHSFHEECVPGPSTRPHGGPSTASRDGGFEHLVFYEQDIAAPSFSPRDEPSGSSDASSESSPGLFERYITDVLIGLTAMSCGIISTSWGARITEAILGFFGHTPPGPPTPPHQSFPDSLTHNGVDPEGALPHWQTRCNLPSYRTTLHSATRVSKRRKAKEKELRELKEPKILDPIQEDYDGEAYCADGERMAGMSVRVA
ncbi:hypothetical protein BO71DRAFT_396626 [Aspergillus ellipticus CBS 707.79]|uniref:Uncharacterized protein n=1 Tax=Aspergillus ellipticus CBS 707.79 TaxID=1448320 RepID=A0A319DZT0_9EURO|nr:hypothetical protein BO71DRAFT_396626 [Aspergillus ellipticus CBS 707.79]